MYVFGWFVFLSFLFFWGLVYLFSLKNLRRERGPSKSPSTAPVGSAVDGILLSMEVPVTQHSVMLRWLSGRWRLATEVSLGDGFTLRIWVGGSTPPTQELRAGVKWSDVKVDQYLPKGVWSGALPQIR